MQQEFQITDPGRIRSKVLNWLKQFDTFCFLDSHQYEDPQGQWDWMAAAGAEAVVELNQGESLFSALNRLDQLVEKKSRWWFGHLSYGLKEHFSAVPNTLPDFHQVSPFSFFSPSILIRYKKGRLTITGDNPDILFASIEKNPCLTAEEPSAAIQLRARLSKEEYIHSLEKIREHIQLGDCYELNFCQEFYAEGASISPVNMYEKLVALSPVPFATLYRKGSHWLLSASPERFLARRGTRLISQPIKGTARRDHSDLKMDQQLSRQLQSSQKERSENVMVVDLVRNDLSRICIPGTVKVDELFGLYSFPQVHQLISTVSGDLQESISFTDILRATFPMGSMTGAPKKRVLELTEQYEKSARGLYAGSVGYINPTGDFDFNVVIRSLVYREDTRYLSFHVGGGITACSQPLQEWEECLVKATALLKVLQAACPV